MSEIAKCPICGDDPGIWFDMFDKRHCNPQGINCCGVECSTPQLWDQYAAAMELAKALNSWLTNNGNYGSVIDAQDRVLEVFK